MALFGKVKEAGTTASKFGTKMLKKIAASAKKMGARRVLGIAQAEIRKKEAKKKVEYIEAVALSPREEHLMNGEILQVISSPSGRVYHIQYFPDSREMMVQYPDASIYQYQEISPQEALGMLNASSHGKWVWINLRILGTVFGYKKPYQLISSFGTPRKWMQTPAARIAHGLVPPSGELYKGWHPLYATGDEEYNPLDPNA